MSAEIVLLRGPLIRLGVPVANSDGSRNIDGVAFDWRDGLPDQPPLYDIPEIESESIVNRQIKHGTPQVVRITNGQVDSVRVTLRFPRLVSVQNNGDTATAEVKFSIAVQPTNVALHGQPEVV